MSDFKAEMHQIRFQLGLRPKPAGEASSSSFFFFALRRDSGSIDVDPSDVAISRQTARDAMAWDKSAMVDRPESRTPQHSPDPIGGAYQGMGGAKSPKFLTVFCVLTVITLLVLS